MKKAEPVGALRSDDNGRLMRLVLERIVRPARRPAPKDPFTACERSSKSDGKDDEVLGCVAIVPLMRFSWPAAFIAAERRPSSVEVITLDDRLAAAARKEGFVLIDLKPSGE